MKTRNFEKISVHTMKTLFSCAKKHSFLSRKLQTLYSKIILIIILIFLVGCTPSKTTSQRTGRADYQIGSEGLEVTFSKEFFPTEVYENEEFVVAFDIENKGAYNINNSRGVLAVGVETSYVSIPTTTAAWPNTRTVTRQATSGPKSNLAWVNIRGRSPEFPKGDKDTVFIRMKAKKLDEREAVHRSRISVNTCYNYQAYTSQSVCIDTDPLNLGKAAKSCEIKDIDLDSQGGPIAITKIESRMATVGQNMVRPEFTIHIKNKGKGLVVNPEKFVAACGGPISETEQFTKDDLNRLNIKATLLDEELECKPIPLRLSSSRDFVKCTLKKESPTDNPGIPTSKGTYKTVLNINLTYGYQFAKSQEFDILQN